MNEIDLNNFQGTEIFSTYKVDVNISHLNQARDETYRAIHLFHESYSEYMGFDIEELPRVCSRRYLSRFPDKFTRTEKTCEIYTKRSQSLLRRFHKHTGLDGLRHTEEFFNWLMLRKQLFTTNTWKGDRAALIYTGRKHMLGKLLGLLLHTNNRGGKNGKNLAAADRLTSSQKQKGVRVTEYKKIMDQYFNTGSGYWQYIGFEFFVTMMSTGIRPIEVTQSYVTYVNNEQGERLLALRVKNAKRTNGRGNGKYRTITIGHHSETIQNVIIDAISRASSPCLANGAPTTPQKYAAYASRAFSHMMKEIFPRRKKKIALYSARHQFAADAKKNGFSPAEVAALMGHASDATAMRSYARITRGHTSSRIPQPLREEVATVRNVHKPLNPKVFTNTKKSMSSAQPTHGIIR